MQDEQHAVGQLREAHRQLRDVRRARRAVDERDRREEEERGDEAHDDVRHARADALARAAEGEQHVRRRQQDLEPDVEVEEVARDERVEDARRQDEVRRVEDRDGRLAVLIGDALPDGVHEDAEQHEADTTSMIADSRSTTSTMPQGGCHAPIATTMPSPEASTATSSITAITSTAPSTLADTAICAWR